VERRDFVHALLRESLYGYVRSLFGRAKGDAMLNRSPIHLLHRAGQCAAEIFHKELPGDLTPRQLAVLVTVAQNEGLSQTGLVERTGIDRSTLADVARRLTKRGLLQRRRTKEDARAYAVKLTDEGRRVLRLAEPSGKRVDARVLNALPSGHREEFITALKTIVERLEGISARANAT
jgi:DNA-binding MarR family transcriptional regulator